MATGCPTTYWETVPLHSALPLQSWRCRHTQSLLCAAHLVGQQQARHRAPIRQRQLAVQVLLPLLAVAEGADVGDIKHDDTG